MAELSIAWMNDMVSLLLFLRRSEFLNNYQMNKGRSFEPIFQADKIKNSLQEKAA
jgi:hypothetical protein